VSAFTNNGVTFRHSFHVSHGRRHSAKPEFSIVKSQIHGNLVNPCPFKSTKNKSRRHHVVLQIYT
jgi:hypothetical protein